MNVTFRTKPHLVTALQAEQDMTVDGSHGPLYVRAGEWVVRDEDVLVLTDEQFQQQYEPIPASTDRGTPYVMLIDGEAATIRDGAAIALLSAAYATNDDGSPRAHFRAAKEDEIIRGEWVSE